jgi:NDP-sugar pyrophosphorylase family protein
MEVFEAQSFFDCPTPLFSDIFKNAEHVWDVIPLIPAYVSEHIRPGLHGFIEEGAWVEEGNVQLDPGSRIERGAIVRGPAIIGSNTIVRSGAYIRGHVMIGSGCIIGNSTEIRQIILMDKSALPHKNDVFTSVIGSNVNLGGMACTANYRLDGKEITIHINVNDEPKKINTGLWHI